MWKSLLEFTGCACPTLIHYIPYIHTPSQSALIYRTLLTYTLCGVLVGSVWFNIHNGDYHARVNVCATSFLCVSMLLVGCVDGKLFV